MTDEQFNQFMVAFAQREKVMEDFVKVMAERSEEEKKVPFFYKVIGGILTGLLVTAIVGLVIAWGDLRVVKFEMTQVREDIRDLRQTIESRTDDRWRKSDHDVYARAIEQWLAKLEAMEHLTKTEIRELVGAMIKYPWEADKKLVEQQLMDLKSHLKELQRKTDQLKEQLIELKRKNGSR